MRAMFFLSVAISVLSAVILVVVRIEMTDLQREVTYYQQRLAKKEEMPTFDMTCAWATALRGESQSAICACVGVIEGANWPASAHAVIDTPSQYCDMTYRTQEGLP